MRRSKTRLTPVLACGAALAMLGSACATTQEEVAPAPTGSEFEQGTGDTGDATPSTPSREYGKVYFDFDRSDLSDEARATLQNDEPLVQAAAGPVVVQGYTDERGTWEYNLALGDRRAHSAKKYLENLGVPGSKLRTVSFGEADPAVEGNNESAWRWNRRVTFKNE